MIIITYFRRRIFYDRSTRRIALFMFVYIPLVINLNMQNPHPVSAPSVVVISHVGLNSVKNWHFIEWGCWEW